MNLADIEVAVTANLEPLKKAHAEAIAETHKLDAAMSASGGATRKAFADVLTELQKQSAFLQVISGETVKLAAAKQGVVAAEKAASQAAAETARVEAMVAAAAKQQASERTAALAAEREAMRAATTEKRAAMEAERNAAKAQRDADLAAAQAAKTAAAEREAAAQRALALAKQRAAEEAAAAVQSARLDPAMWSPQLNSDLDDYAKSLDEVRAKINPVYAAQLKYKESQDMISDALARGAINAKEAAAAQLSVDRAYVATTSALAAAGMPVEELGGKMTTMGQKAQLSANQLLNLSRQGNDVLTMAALGAPPMQIFASQIGQIYGALQENPGGVRGSLDAMKSWMLALPAAMGPAGAIAVSVGAITAAVATYAYIISDKIPDADTTFKKHDEILSRIAAKYGQLSDQVKQLGEMPLSPRVDAGKILRDLETIRKEREKTFARNIAGSDTMGNPLANTPRTDIDGSQSAVLPKFQPIEAEIVRFRDELAAGAGDITTFAARLETMYEQAGDDKELRKAIESAIEYAQSIADVDAKVREMKRALMEATPAFKAMAEGARIANDAIGKITEMGAPARNAYEELVFQMERYQRESGKLASTGEAERAHLRALAELARDARDALADSEGALSRVGLNPRAMAEAEQAARSAKEIAEVMRTNGSPEAVAAAQRKAEVDMQRVRAQGAEDFARQSSQRVQSIADEVTALETQAKTLGMSAGAAAEYTVRTEALAAAKRAANDAGYVVSEQEIAAINEGARQVGLLTSALAGMSAEQDLLFERSQLYRSDLDAQIAARQRSAGIDADSDAGRRIDDLMRGNAQRTQMRDNFRGFFQGLAKDVREASSAMDVFQSISDRALSVVDKYLDKTLEGMADKLFSMTMPLGDVSSTLTMPSVAPISTVGSMTVTAANVMINGGVGGLLDSAAGATGLAPLGQVTRAALPALSDKGGRVLDASARVSSAFDVTSSGGVPSLKALTDYTIKAANDRGIDVVTALKVARSEGLQQGTWQSLYKNSAGQREPSFGPFQLLKGGKGTGFPEGMGNAFQRATGLDPADPKNAFAGIDYALDGAAKNGWGAWYGAAKVGVGRREGLENARAIGVSRQSNDSLMGGSGQSQLGGGMGSDRLLSKATESVSQAGTQLGGVLQKFGTDFDLTSKVMINGMEGTVQDFLPQFGGNLQKLLGAVSGAGGAGGAGGLLDLLAGSRSRATGISLGATKAILGGAAGLFANGGIANSPSIFGEAGPEAAVPLPDGRSIPVMLSMPKKEGVEIGQKSSMNLIVSPTINVQGSAGTQDQNEDLARETTKQIRDMVRAIMTKELETQRRNGGTLRR